MEINHAVILSCVTTFGLWITIVEGTNFTKRGTLPNLREIIVGRCIEYQNKLVFWHSDYDKELRSKNCTQIWEYFYKSFAFKHPCDVRKEDYEEFLQASKTTIPKNMATYWDGWDIYPIVSNYANKGQRSVTLETTLPGYLGNGISFCGSTTDPDGLEFKNCPNEGECGFGIGAIDAFWSRMSTYFGAEGSGDLKVFFNSNRDGGAFHENGSFFYEFEILNLNTSHVNHMDIFVVTELSKPKGDTCDSPSLIRLGAILDQRKISHTCYEQPQAVLHVLCADQPKHPDCQFKVKSSDFLTQSSSSSSSQHQKLFRIIFTCVLALYMALLQLF